MCIRLTSTSSTSTCATQSQILAEDRVDRPQELALDQIGHAGGRAAQPVEVGVELAVGVVHLLVPRSLPSLIRTAR